jgi:hypothetical protein
MAKPKPDDERTVRPFAATLQELEKGATHADLSDYIQQVTAAVIETGKPGSVTLKLAIKPMDDGEVVVATGITKVVPEHDRKATRFFVDGDNNLTRDLPVETTPLLQGLPAGSIDTGTRAVGQ